MGKLGGSTRGAEHDSISVLSISALLPPDGVRAGDDAIPGIAGRLRRVATRGVDMEWWQQQRGDDRG